MSRLFWSWRSRSTPTPTQRAVAVEAALVALLVPLHGPEPLEDVLVGARPGVVDAHRLGVRGDRAVDEPEKRPGGVLLAENVEAPLALPHLEHLVLELRQV